MVKKQQDLTSEFKARKASKNHYPMVALLRVPCAILFLMVISIFFTWFVFWRQNLNDANAAWEFIQEKPYLAEYSYIVLFCILAVLASLTWRPFLSTGIFFCFLSVITFINAQKFNLRAAPLLPEEFQMADQTGNLIQFVDSEALSRLIFGIIFILIGSLLAEHYIRKFVGRNTKNLAWWDKYALVPRTTFTMITLALLVSIAAPIIHRKNLSWIEDLDLVAWNQTTNYEENGFVIGFLYNLGSTDIQKPENYSESIILRIADKYRALQVEDNKERKDLDEVAENVIVILSETTYDPTLLEKYYSHTGDDIIPNIHRIFRKYPSGYMYSPDYGGGTANVEFEVQTGLSNYWAMTVPYVNVIPKLDSLISVAGWGDSFGYDTTAVHSYDGSMYKRNLVYKIMDYDDFIDESRMNNTAKESDSAFVYNDQSVYREIIELLESNDNPQIINAVTMQNHAPYAQANYPELDFLLDNAVDDGWAIEANFQSLHNADKYLGEFIEALDNLDERTIVLWFGDHAMGTLHEYIDSKNKSERDLAHLTPYFIYANFDLESPYTTQEVAKMNAKQGFKFPTSGVNLPTTTPNCLLNTMYNLFDLKKPSLFYLVDKVCEQTPILAHAYETTDQTIKMTSVLKEYMLVNYDILAGKQYWDGQ